MKKRLSYPPDAPDRNTFKLLMKSNMIKGTITSAVESLEQLFCYTFKRNKDE